LKNKRILITGAAGFIGTHLTRYLLEKNYDLVLTCHKKKISREFKNYATCISLDLTRKESLERKTPTDIGAVFHLANFVSNSVSWETVRESFEINAFGTLRLLCHCRNLGVRRFVSSSSISVYGAHRQGRISERHSPEPDTYYGMSKFMGELFCERFNTLNTLSAVSLRYSSVYGVGQKPDTVLPLFINKTLKDKEMEIYGKGKKIQDFVYVKDVVEANYRAFHSNERGSFNIASGKGTNIVDLAHLIKDIFSSGRSRVVLNSEKPGDNTDYYFDISKAKKKLGYDVNYSLRKGLMDYRGLITNT